MSSLRTAGPRSAGDSFVFLVLPEGLVGGLAVGLASTFFGFSGIGL